MLATNGAHYLVVIEPSGAWDNGRFEIPVGGFSAKDPPKWYQRLYLTLSLPLRRELLQDWFRIGLRYGRVGGEEDFFEPDPTDPVIQNNIHPTRNGELFIFVNDAVLGIPGLYGWFYRNNGGSAQLTVTRTR
jgi:hypothetical protein